MRIQALLFRLIAFQVAVGFVPPSQPCVPRTRVRGSPKEEREGVEVVVKKPPVLFALFPARIEQTSDLLPYLVVGFLVYWRGKKAYKFIQKRQAKLLEDYGAEIARAAARPQTRKTTFYKTRVAFRRKLWFLRGKAMVIKAVDGIIKPRVSINSLRAFEDLLAVYKVKNVEKFVEDVAEEITASSDRGKLLYYAKMLGAKDLPNLEALVLKSLKGNEDLLAATQRTYADAAYLAIIQKTKEPDIESAAMLGIDEDRAQAIYDNTFKKEPEPEKPVKEAWLQELEAKVTAESGPVDMVSDNLDKVDAFGNRIDGDDTTTTSQYEGKELTIECQNCGHTMFIAKGRDFKFFGPSFTCPTCGASRDQQKVTVIDESEFLSL